MRRRRRGLSPRILVLGVLYAYAYRIVGQEGFHSSALDILYGSRTPGELVEGIAGSAPDPPFMAA